MPSHYARALILLVCYVLTLHYCACADDDDEPAASNSNSMTDGASSSARAHRADDGANQCGVFQWIEQSYSSSYRLLSRSPLNRDHGSSYTSSDDAGRALASIITIAPGMPRRNVLLPKFWSSRDATITLERSAQGSKLCFTLVNPKKTMSVSFSPVQTNNIVAILDLAIDNMQREEHSQKNIWLSKHSSLSIVTTIGKESDTVFSGAATSTVYAPIYDYTQSDALRSLNSSRGLLFQFNSEKPAGHMVCLSRAGVSELTLNFGLFSLQRHTLTFAEFSSRGISSFQPWVYRDSILSLKVQTDRVLVECNNFTCGTDTSIVFSPLAVAIDHVKGNVLKASFDLTIVEQCSAEAFLVQSQSLDITDSKQLCAGTYLKIRHKRVYLKSKIVTPRDGRMLAILIVHVKCTMNTTSSIATLENIKIKTKRS